MTNQTMMQAKIDTGTAQRINLRPKVQKEAEKIAADTTLAKDGYGETKVNGGGETSSFLGSIKSLLFSNSRATESSGNEVLSQPEAAPLSREAQTQAQSVELLPTEDQVSGWAEFALTHSEGFELALEKLANFDSGKTFDRTIRKAASWGAKHLSTDEEVASNQRRGLMNTLSAVGSREVDSDTVTQAADRLLRMNFDSKIDSKQEAVDFGVRALTKLVIYSRDPKLQSAWFENDRALKGVGSKGGMEALLSWTNKDG